MEFGQTSIKLGLGDGGGDIDDGGGDRLLGADGVDGAGVLSGGDCICPLNFRSSDCANTWDRSWIVPS